MQELKDSVRNSIINAALQEFLKNGFEGTSIRSIASNSGISHGNIYRYFKNKEILYESLVEKSEICTLEMLKEILIPIDPGKDVLIQIDRMAEKMAQHIIGHRDNIILLLEKGPKDRVIQMREKAIQMVSHFFKHHIGQKGPFEDDFFLNLTSTNIYIGFLEITKSHKDFQWIRKNLHLLVRYHLFGMANFAL